MKFINDNNTTKYWHNYIQDKHDKVFNKNVKTQKV